MESFAEIKERLKFLVDTLARGKHTVFAKECGIPTPTFQAYYHGERNPSLDHLIKIKSRFEINLNWLLSDEGEPFIQEGVEAFRRDAISPAAEDMIREIAMAVEEWLNQRGLTLTSAKTVDLVIELYRKLLKEGRKVDKDMVGEVFLKLVA